MISMTVAQVTGAAIRNRRRGWPYRMSVRELSARTGIPASTIYAYERGQCMPSLEIAIKIARVIDLDLNHLVRTVQIA